MPAPNFETVNQTAEILGVNPRTVRRMIARGEIQARRVGPRLIRVNLDSLNDVGRTMQHIGAA